MRIPLFVTWITLFACLLLVVPATAQPLAELATVDAGAVVYLKTDGSKGEVVSLFLVPEDPAFIVLPIYGGQDAKNQPIVRPFGIAPKKTGLSAVLVAVEGDVIVRKIVPIVVGPEPRPDPGPDPKPDPRPEPLPPVVAKVWAIVVYSSDDRDDARYYDVLMERDLQEIGPPAVYGGLVKIDAAMEGQSTSNQSWITRARADGKTLPWLFVVGDGGQILTDAALPDTPDAVERMVKQYLPRMEGTR